MEQKRLVPNEDRPLVLVADDDGEVRSALRLWLEECGYEVAEAEDGVEAVKAAKRERPALILMEVSLPRLDGCAAMLSIRENEETRDVPIVALSALEFAGLHPLLRMDAIRAGLAGYVTMPLDLARLGDLLSRLLRVS